MSAIELMDPKMDAGMLENQSKTKIKSFKQAIQVLFFHFKIKIIKQQKNFF